MKYLFININSWKSIFETFKKPKIKIGLHYLNSKLYKLLGICLHLIPIFNNSDREVLILCRLLIHTVDRKICIVVIISLSTIYYFPKKIKHIVNAVIFTPLQKTYTLSNVNMKTITIVTLNVLELNLLAVYHA